MNRKAMNIKTNPLKMLFKLSALLVKNSAKARTKPPNAKVTIPFTAFVPKESPIKFTATALKNL